MTTARAAFEALDAYQNGDMPAAEASGFEEELFAAAAVDAADEASFVDRLSLIGQYLAPRAGFDVGSSRARVDALIAAGLRVQLFEPEPAPVMRAPPIDPNAEIVVSHFRIDVRGFDSVDVMVETPDGTQLKTLRDVSWDATDGTIYMVCEAPLARISLQQWHLRSHVIGRRAGQQHTIAVFETVVTP